MGRDIKTKQSKQSKQQKHDNKTKNKKELSSSDDDSDSFIVDDSSTDEMDSHEYRKFLKKVFPSKHLDNKIKSGERMKKAIKKDSKKNNVASSDSEEDEKLIVKKRKQQKKKIVSESEREDDDEDVCEEDLTEDSDYEEEDEEDDVDNEEKQKFNIFLTIGAHEDEYDDYDDQDESWKTCSTSETENEDDPISTDDDDENDEKDDKDDKDTKKNKKNKDKDKDSSNTDTNEQKEENILEDDGLNQLQELLEKNPNNKKIQKCIELYKENIKNEKEKNQKKVAKEKARNSRIFKRIIRDKNTMNDYEFYDNMDVDKQKRIIKELREINKIMRVEKPYRLTLLESDIPVQFKASALKKINTLRFMEPGSGEYYKMKNWVDNFMRIPFNNYKTLQISAEDGVEKCHDFMENAKNILDSSVYGLNDAKMQIMQMLGQLITNPKAIGSAIAIHGPPGTGKTTLVKEGISKILNRPFAFIALGGATDSSFLEGHGYTYEGSTWGKIVQILIDSKCMNPVIYFDELDKISDTPKGEEITGILTHLTDTSQNSQFHDKYFAEIDFDLSKCLFIFSYNDESKVNPILKDRMYRIQTKGYNQKQKLNISYNHLLPKIREQVKFTSDEIIIPENTINYIAENYCFKEDGVRNLKRCLEIIHTKLNLYRLMRPDTNLFQEDMSIKVTFPFTVTKEIVDKLIKRPNEIDPSFYHLYV